MKFFPLKIKREVLFVALLFVCTSFANAHSDLYADVKINAVFDEKGFVGVQNIWSFDEVYSREMLAVADEDGDGRFSLNESELLKNEVLAPFMEADCFNHVLSGANFLRAKGIEKFSAKNKDGRLVLDFLVAYPVVPAISEYSMLVIAVWDPLHNILMTVDMDDSGVKNRTLDVEYFADKLDGLTLFRGFSADAEGLFVRFKKK